MWKNGVIAVSFNYRDFSPHGNITFYDNGAILASLTAVDGKYIGPCKFYLNKHLLFSGDYFHGDINGVGKLYYPNGSIFYEGEFRNGYADGFGSYYDETGEKYYSDSWRKGKSRVFKTIIALPSMVIAIDQVKSDSYTETEFSYREKAGIFFYFSTLIE